MNIETGTLKGRFHNNQGSVGTTRAQLNTDGREALRRGVTVKAATGNADVVYVGGPEVSTTTGYPLVAGESLYLPAMFTDQIWVVGGASAQGFAWIGI